MNFKLKFQKDNYLYTSKKIYWDANSSEMKKYIELAFAEDR